MRDVGDARIEIDAIHEVPPGVSEVTPPAAAARARTTLRPWIAVATLATAVVVWETRRPVATPESPFANARLLPLTNWEGTEEGAEISPDGKFVAFLADHDGEFDIWLSQIGTGHFTNLTRDVPPLGHSTSHLMGNTLCSIVRGRTRSS